ncbi:cathepsin B-like [Brevipalpus obovatus]|uniref:cathepsin B-like n=1 Tax=Brevipalpus obovatus TaxID=246614 RepID=UPI003D9E5A04
MIIFLQIILCAFWVLGESGKIVRFSGIPPLSDEMIDRINSMSTTWKAGRNFDHSELQYVKRLLGVKKSGHKSPVKPVEILDDIPDNFDARTHWPDCDSIPLIRDQSNCGACWAFGAVEAMSDRICIASAGKVKVSISSQDLVACGNLGGCDGGDPASAWQYWVDNGLVTGGLYGGVGCLPYSIEPGHHGEPYVPTPPCNPTCQPGYPKTYAQDKHFGASAYSVGSDVKAIQSEIMKNGPVEADFSVYADFLSYKSGVYIQHSQDYLGGHAIRILGWGVENDVPYWLAANSWNTTWGDHGYFKIRRGTDECGIEDDMQTGLPKLQFPVN